MCSFHMMWTALARYNDLDLILGLNLGFFFLTCKQQKIFAFENSGHKNWPKALRRMLTYDQMINQ